MTGAPDHPLTVKWLLFGFRGRIGRKSFLLAALLMLLVQGALIAMIAGTEEGSAMEPILGLVLLGVWIATAWASLALAVKRLHDLDMPPILAICLIIPAISFFAWLFLAVMPSKQEVNEHGPPPFPRR